MQTGFFCPSNTVCKTGVFCSHLFVRQMLINTAALAAAPDVTIVAISDSGSEVLKVERMSFMYTSCMCFRINAPKTVTQSSLNKSISCSHILFFGTCVFVVTGTTQ